MNEEDKKYIDRISSEIRNIICLSSSKVLEYPDEELEYYIYEELNGDYEYLNPLGSFNTDLLQNGVITEQVFEMLPKLFDLLEQAFNDENKRCANFIRKNIVWLQVFQYANIIVAKMNDPSIR